MSTHSHSHSHSSYPSFPSSVVSSFPSAMSAPSATSSSPSSSLFPSPGAAARPPAPKLVVKLTHRLMETYNAINEKYYANKKKRSLEQAAAKAKAAQSSASQSQSSSSSQPATQYNDGYDDKDYNYIVRQNEKLNNRYLVEHSLGKGSFGRVVKCLDLLTGRPVAVKIVKSKSAFYKQAQIELKILNSIQMNCEKHNIVALLDHFMHHNHQCIVFELLSINLYDLLRNTRFQGVSLLLIAKFAHQILHTLDFLASQERGEKRVIHCDLKPENVLLVNPKKSAIRVIDFGSAAFSSQKVYTYIQSRFYRAPEVLLNLPYDTEIDMFSLGAIMMELHTGHPLFDGHDEADQIVKQCEVLGVPPPEMLENNRKAERYFEKNEMGQWQLKRKYRTEKFSTLRLALGSKYVCNVQYEQFLDLVGQMLQYDPKKRIRPSVAMMHPFFNIFKSSDVAAAQSVSASAPSPQSASSPASGPAPMEATESAAVSASASSSSSSATVAPSSSSVNDSVPMETHGDPEPQSLDTGKPPIQPAAPAQPQSLASSGDTAMSTSDESSVTSQNPKKRPHSNPIHVPNHLLQAQQYGATGGLPITASHSIVVNVNASQGSHPHTHHAHSNSGSQMGSHYFAGMSQASSASSSVSQSQAATPRKNSFGSSRDAQQPKTGSLGRAASFVPDSPVNSISSRAVPTTESDSDADYGRGDWDSSGLAFSPAVAPRSGSLASNTSNFPRLEGSGSFSGSGALVGLALGSSTSSSANNSCRSSPSTNQSSLHASKSSAPAIDPASVIADLPLSSDPTSIALDAWRRRKGEKELANQNSSPTPTNDDESLQDYQSADSMQSGVIPVDAWASPAEMKSRSGLKHSDSSSHGVDSPARAHFSRMSINEEQNKH